MEEQLEKPKPHYQSLYTYHFIAPPPSNNVASDQAVLFKSYDSVPQARIFELDSLFSPQECDYLRTQADLLQFDDISNEYPVAYRNNKRLLVKSADLSSYLYERLMKHAHLFKSQWEQVKPFGIGTEGTWVPNGISEIVKFSKYPTGSKFFPHMDNCIVNSADERSIFTMVIYLNDDFQGGATFFHTHMNELPFLPENVGSTRLLKIVPKKGSCLLFNHDVIHEGEEVILGEKYIIRVEVMFTRVATQQNILQDNQLAMNPLFGKAFELYNSADQLITMGDVNQGTQEYLKALTMLTKFSPSIRNWDKQQRNHIDAQPHEILIHVFTWHFLVQDERVWVHNAKLFGLINEEGERVVDQLRTLLSNTRKNGGKVTVLPAIRYSYTFGLLSTRDYQSHYCSQGPNVHILLQGHTITCYGTNSYHMKSEANIKSQPLWNEDDNIFSNASKYALEASKPQLPIYSSYGPTIGASPMYSVTKCSPEVTILDPRAPVVLVDRVMLEIKGCKLQDFLFLHVPPPGGEILGVLVSMGNEVSKRVAKENLAALMNELKKDLNIEQLGVWNHLVNNVVFSDDSNNERKQSLAKNEILLHFQPSCLLHNLQRDQYFAVAGAKLLAKSNYFQ